MRDREAALSSGLGVGFARGCRPGFKSRSNRWFGFFSGCPGFNSPRFAKQLTGCLLPVGTLNHVSFKLLRLGCLLTSMIAKCSSTINKAITITLQLRENIFFLNAYAKFWKAKKEYYGIFLKWPTAKIRWIGQVTVLENEEKKRWCMSWATVFDDHSMCWMILDDARTCFKQHKIFDAIFFTISQFFLMLNVWSFLFDLLVSTNSTNMLHVRIRILIKQSEFTIDTLQTTRCAFFLVKVWFRWPPYHFQRVGSIQQLYRLVKPLQRACPPEQPLL